VHGALGTYCGTAAYTVRDDPGPDASAGDEHVRHECAVEGHDRLVVGSATASVGLIGLTITLATMPHDRSVHG
jgi:hypothetical protein